MFSSTKFLIIIICTAEAKLFYNPDEPPLVRVNGVSLEAKPVYLSEVDYVAEYQYMEGDKVDVRCYTIDIDRENISMEYPLADTFSDIFDTTSLPLGGSWGFKTILYSGHNNSYVMCSKEESGIKVMVKFIMPTELPLVSINIDGVAIWPQKKKHRANNTYLIQYQIQNYNNYEEMTVVCGVDEENLYLVVTDSNQTNYKQTELIRSKQAEMSFKPMSDSNQLTCSANSSIGAIAEEVIISYHTGPRYFITLELTSRDKMPVLQVYSTYDYYYKFSYYFYEFEAGETLDLNCTFRQRRWYEGVLYLNYLEWYLQSEDSETCGPSDCTLSKQLNLTSEDNNTKYSFYGMLLNKETNDTNSSIAAEVRVIFRMINNKTKSWQSFYQNSEGKTAVLTSEATDPGTTTIIVSVVSTVGGALVLCGLTYLILRLRRRNYGKQLRLRIAANTAPQFYLNLILREDCDRQIADIDQHVYEEIGPPVYDVIDNRDHEDIDEPDYAEIEIPAHAENNGAVCEESVAPVSEEIHAPMHENIDNPVHEDINTPVHEEIDAPVHGEINTPVHEEIDAPVHGEINTPVNEEIDAPVHVDNEAFVYEPMHRSLK